MFPYEKYLLHTCGTVKIFSFLNYNVATSTIRSYTALKSKNKYLCEGGGAWKHLKCLYNCIAFS